MDFSLSGIGNFLMNEIYAIDPSAPEDLKDLKMLSELFGFSQGRFIAKYPDDWVTFLKNNVGQLGSIDQSRASVLLKRFHENSLPVSGTYFRGKDWLSNAVNLQDKQSKFTRIVTTPNNKNLPSLGNFLYEEDLPDSHGEHIGRDINSYRKSIAPLFQSSTEIHVQDMFFYFYSNGVKQNRIWEVARMICDLAITHERCEKLVFHLNQEGSETQRLDESFLQIREESNSRILKIVYTLEDKKLSHGRYIFSIKGGLQFDHGFDTTYSRDNKKTNHVHWMSEKELLPLLDRYRI